MSQKQKKISESYEFKPGWLQILTFFTGILLSVFSLVVAVQVVLTSPPVEVKGVVNTYHITISSMHNNGASFDAILNYKIETSKTILHKLWYLYLLPVVFMTITIMSVIALNYRSVTVILLDKINQYRYMYTQERQRKKHALIELEKSEEHLFKVHEQLSEGFIVVTKDERFTHGNRLAVQYLARWSKGSRTEKAYRGQLLETYIPGYMVSGLGTLVRDAISKDIMWQKEIHLEEISTWLDVRIYPSSDGGAYIYF